MFNMFYAERINHVDGSIEKGIFLSVNEFVPYRAIGWEAAKENNEAADAILRDRINNEIARAALAKAKGE